MKMEPSSHLAKRLKFARTTKGFSQIKLAELLGVTQGLISQIENGNNAGSTYLIKIAIVLQVSPNWLIGEIGTDKILIPYNELHLSSTINNATITRITVRGHVEAGHWQEAIEFDETYTQLVQSNAVPEDYNVNKIYGLIIKGESMNMIHKEGDLLICVSIYDIKRKLKTGDHVIVEREHGGKHEATVKELEIDENGKMTLWPRSTSPDHKSPIVINYIEGDNIVNDIIIRITGVVLTSVSITKRF